MQVFLTPDYLAIAMEYASGGDLFSLVLPLTNLHTFQRWYRALVQPEYTPSQDRG